MPLVHRPEKGSDLHTPEGELPRGVATNVNVAGIWAATHYECGRRDMAGREKEREREREREKKYE